MEPGSSVVFGGVFGEPSGPPPSFPGLVPVVGSDCDGVVRIVTVHAGLHADLARYVILVGLVEIVQVDLDSC